MKNERRIRRFAFATLVALGSALALGAVPPRLSPSDLATGRMLVATRQVGGPIFGESIVLLLAYGKTEGAVGLIINRRSQHPLETIVPDLGDAKIAESPIYLGGPVSPETVQLAWRTDETPDGARRVLEDVHTSARTKVLEQLVRADTPAEKVRAYIGYSGWSPGQLENEIARGDWIVIRGDPKLVFHPAPDLLWPRLIGAHEGLQARRHERGRGSPSVTLTRVAGLRPPPGR